jgi:aminoglycoside phosphotransferase (APT) family kinase protein
VNVMGHMDDIACVRLQSACALLSEIFPEITVARLRLLGEGWDSTAVLVNEELVFRIPKRVDVASGMQREMELLKVIQHHVTASVPNIQWVGPGRGVFAVTAMGYRKLPGRALSQISTVNDTQHLSKIALFLKELHAIPVEALSSAPWFCWTGSAGREGPVDWESGLRSFVDRIFCDGIGLLNPSVQTRVRHDIETFLAVDANFQFKPVLIHGDFSTEHILVEEGNENMSIIDFGDSGLGDAAYDVWPILNPYYQNQNTHEMLNKGGMEGSFSGHEIHGETSEKVDSTFVVRQKFYRRLAPFHSIIYGLINRDDGLVKEGLRQVENTFATNNNQ